MGDLSFVKLRGLLKDYEHYVENKDKKRKFGMYQSKDMHFRALVAYGWASDFLTFAQKALSDKKEG